MSAMYARHVEDVEVQLTRIEEMLASATSCVSRIIFQLQENAEKIDIRPKNVPDFLSEIGLRLERMILAINRNQNVTRAESVNTDFLYIKPPVFMNLNDRVYASTKD